MSRVQSPFKFLDSYQKTDADVFFGREKETIGLYDALSGVKHLLVYGPSGSGKTSLVECGLRNRFSDADWFALTIRKGANINASVYMGINNVLKNSIDMNTATNLQVDDEVGFGEAVDKLFKERFQPVYLLFDQFEELLISGDAAEKNVFFDGLNKLIRSKVPCRIMLIMREEFIGHLSEFESLCPSIFQHRFRVEKMGRSNVEDVIFHILEAPAYRNFFTVVDSRKLVETILSKLPDKKKEIELAHVQVFLGELWDRARAGNKTTGLPVLNVALIKDEDNLEAILESFLKKQMADLEAAYGERIPLELLAAMISEKFTKLQMSGAAIKADLAQKKVVGKKPVDDLLKELEQRRIIRTLKAGDETQFEISHDVLALVVGQNLTEEMKMREKAEEIYNVYQARPGLFSQDDIDYLRRFKDSLDYPPGLQTRISQSSVAMKRLQEQELVKTRKRLRIVYSLLAAAMLALVAAGYFWFDANEQKKVAQANYLISEAKGMVATDPTLSLRLAEQAMLHNGDSSIENSVLKIYTENSFYKIIASDSGGIYTVAFSPNGEKIVTGGKNGSIRLWDLNGKLTQAFTDKTRFINTVSVLQDNNTVLATFTRDSTALLWNTSTKQSVVLKALNHETIIAGAFSSKKNRVVTVTNKGAIQEWDLAGRKTGQHSSVIFDKLIHTVAFSPGTDTILVISESSARLWDIPNEKIIMDLKGVVNEFKKLNDRFSNPAAFSPDGKTFIIGAIDGTARLRGIKGNLLEEFSGSTGKIIATAFAPGGNKVVTGSDDKVARLWDLDGNVIKEFRGHTGNIYSVAFSPDGNKMLTGSDDRTARTWAINGNLIQLFEGQATKTKSITLAPRGRSILSGSNDTTRLWNLQTGLVDTLFIVDSDFNPTVAVSATGDSIFMISSDDTARLWNRKAEVIGKFAGFKVGTNSAVFSPDGNTVLIGGVNKMVRLLNLRDGTITEFPGHRGPINSVAWSPDGKTFVTCSDDATARLWTLKGDSLQIFRGHSGRVFSVAFAPDGKTILTGSADNTARLWDLNGNTIAEFTGHAKSITSVAFSPNGKVILSGSDDKTARLWNLDGTLIYEYKAHTDKIIYVSFLPGGNTFLTATEDGGVRLWNVAGSVSDFLKSNDFEPLSGKQKKQYGIK